MRFEDINPKELLMKKYEKQKDNVIGRYSCSKIYAILKGWTTPEQYVKGEEIDFPSAFRMWNGTWRHKQGEDLVEGLIETEVKKEIEVEGLTIVGMADYLLETQVADMKTSNEVYPKAKEWHLHQVKLYCTLFEKEEGLVFQPVYKMDLQPNKIGQYKKVPSDFQFKIIGRVRRNDAWFKQEINKLKEFNELCKSIKK